MFVEYPSRLKALNFENPRNFRLFLFYNVYKEKMLTVEIEDE